MTRYFIIGNFQLIIVVVVVAVRPSDLHRLAFFPVVPVALPVGERRRVYRVVVVGVGEEGKLLLHR